jgi:hypothetical protein
MHRNSIKRPTVRHRAGRRSISQRKPAQAELADQFGAHQSVLPPEPGKMRSKVITIEITRKGRVNLHKFDAKMQAQLEGYLVALGILNAGQTLSANEQQPGEDAFQSEPAFQE